MYQRSAAHSQQQEGIRALDLGFCRTSCWPRRHDITIAGMSFCALVSLSQLFSNIKPWQVPEQPGNAISRPPAPGFSTYIGHFHHSFTNIHHLCLVTNPASSRSCSCREEKGRKGCLHGSHHTQTGISSKRRHRACASTTPTAKHIGDLSRNGLCCCFPSIWPSPLQRAGDNSGGRASDSGHNQPHISVVCTHTAAQRRRYAAASVTRRFGTWRYLQAPTRSSVVTCVLICVGPGTKTQQELWRATAGPSTALSASSAATFNQQASALQKRLNSQAGGSIQLVIANAIWTKDIAVRKSYADEMKASFNVSCSHT